MMKIKLVTEDMIFQHQGQDLINKKLSIPIKVCKLI